MRRNTRFDSLQKYNVLIYPFIFKQLQILATLPVIISSGERPYLFVFINA